MAARYGIRYTLPDDLKALYQKFGIDLETYNDDDSWTLPLPARLIIGTDGVLRYAAINVDYTVRPDPAETLAALKKVVGKTITAERRAGLRMYARGTKKPNAFQAKWPTVFQSTPSSAAASRSTARASAPARIRLTGGSHRLPPR